MCTCKYFWLKVWLSFGPTHDIFVGLKYRGSVRRLFALWCGLQVNPDDPEWCHFQRALKRNVYDWYRFWLKCAAHPLFQGAARPLPSPRATAGLSSGRRDRHWPARPPTGRLMLAFQLGSRNRRPTVHYHESTSWNNVLGAGYHWGNLTTSPARCCHCWC